MAAEPISEWRVSALPAIPIVGRKYNKKAVADTGFRPFITNSAGVAVPLDAPTVAEMVAALLLKQDLITAGTSGQYYAWDKTWKTLDKAAVGLGNVDNTNDLAKPISTPAAAAFALKADKVDVVNLAGSQTITGVKDFSVSPTIPNATTGNHPAAFNQVTTANAALQTQIDNLATSLASGLKAPVDINCSANPNYPAAVKGDNYIVTVAGKIGGASGEDVEIGDWIICKTNSAAGTQAAVGANWFIVQRNTGIATEVLIGLLRKATTAEAVAGTSDVGAMTALKTSQFSDARNVRFDAAQALTTPQKTQALANIGGVSDSNVLHLLGNLAETATGNKTFSGLTKVKRGLSSVSESYFEMEPSDFGAGKHRMRFYHSPLGNRYDIEVDDGTGTRGTLNIASLEFMWMDKRVATQEWSTAAFAPIIHSHAFASLTAKPTTLAGYGITDGAMAADVLWNNGATPEW